MKTWKIINILIIFNFIISTTYASEDLTQFENFELKGTLLQAAKSLANKKRTKRNVKTHSDIDNKSINDQSLVFTKIQEAIGSIYNDIGEEQTRPLILNHDIGGGVYNFSGFTWHKPFANFKMYVNRQLAPDLFSDRYIIHDTLVIDVKATTLLKNLKELDMIKISTSQINAFIGVSFQRTYSYSHFADTYIEGLSKDYSKLFLSFTKFAPNNLFKLDQYEIIKKKDIFSFNAGGSIETPPFYNISLGAGVLINYSMEKEVKVQSLGENDSPKDGELLRVSIDKSIRKSVEATLSLQLDFFKLLKITLLSYDLEYEYMNAHKKYYSFFEDDHKNISDRSSHYSEFSSIVSGSEEPAVIFNKNVVASEERTKEDLSSKYSVLLLGKLRKSQTEQITITNENETKVFYKHYSSAVRIIQNFWSKILNLAVSDYLILILVLRMMQS
jgi:hypothetical protein